jgi:hypothetical protein
MNEREKNKQKEWTDDDRIVFIPDKDARAIERALHNMEQAQSEFRKISSSMKPLDQENLSVENG